MQEISKKEQYKGEKYHTEYDNNASHSPNTNNLRENNNNNKFIIRNTQYLTSP
jgi:hypothetical protein